MGTLEGSLLLGSFFLCFGLWSAWCIMEKYFLSKREQEMNGRPEAAKSLKYKNTLLFPCCCCKRVPLAAILILASATTGFIIEWIDAMSEGHFVNLGNGLHMTTYFFYGLMAVASILEHYRLHMIPKLDYIAGLLALFIEGVLFIYPLDGRTAMDAQVHIFLLYLILGAFFATCFEMVFPKNVVPAIGRAYFTVLQGSWFLHVGILLYPKDSMAKWDEESSSQLVIVTMIFTWHFAGVFIFFYLMALVVSYRVKCMSRANVYTALELQKDLTGNGIPITIGGGNRNSDQTSIINFDDSEEDAL